MKLIYVCSPYRGETRKAERKNIKRARSYCRLMYQQGGIPFAPHLLFTQFLKDANPRHRRLGMNMGIEMLKHCDELWAFGKPSAGMAAEISFAMDYGIPIFWFDSEGRSIPSE